MDRPSDGRAARRLAALFLGREPVGDERAAMEHALLLACQGGRLVARQGRAYAGRRRIARAWVAALCERRHQASPLAQRHLRLTAFLTLRPAVRSVFRDRPAYTFDAGDWDTIGSAGAGPRPRGGGVSDGAPRRLRRRLTRSCRWQR